MNNSINKIHPLKDLFQELSNDLDSTESNEIQISENDVPISLDKDNFQEITDIPDSKKIAFVDGGDGILEEAPNFLITINRIYFSMFRGKERFSPKNIKSRIEFFSSVVTKILDEDNKKEVMYKTKLFPYNKQDTKLLPEETDLESKTNSTTILESERLTSLSRRFAEWKLAQEIVKEELVEGDIIVKDGSLQSNFKNETKYANHLYELAMEKGVVVCGLSKTSRLIDLDQAEPIITKIQRFAEKSGLDKWFFEIGRLPGDDMGFNLIAKFHKNSNYIFRFEILAEQYEKMSDLERNEILASFVNNSSDMAAIGYPYGFVDADRFAQVRKNELPMYKGMLIAQIGNHPEYKKFHSLASSTKFHDELNKVTS